MGGGGGGGSGPTVQQQQLETMQAQQNANLNLEENSQRKTILNAMQGTRVFRGSALSRALAGNTDGSAAAATGPASKAQNTATGAPPAPSKSLLDPHLQGNSSGSGPAQAGNQAALSGQEAYASSMRAAYAAASGRAP